MGPTGTDSKVLPIFPLQLVVYPNEALNLHIFEQRYRQLIRECMEEDKPFLIPPYINGRIENIGTLVRVETISRTYEDGRMDITTLATDLYRLAEVENPLEGKLYAGAIASRMPWDTKGNPDNQLRIRSLLVELHQKLEIYKKIPGLDEDFNTYRIAHLVGFNIEQEFAFLGLGAESDRERFMETHLLQLLPVVEEIRQLHIKAKMNGHFRNLEELDF